MGVAEQVGPVAGEGPEGGSPKKTGERGEIGETGETAAGRTAETLTRAERKAVEEATDEVVLEEVEVVLEDVDKVVSTTIAGKTVLLMWRMKVTSLHLELHKEELFLAMFGITMYC